MPNVLPLAQPDDPRVRAIPSPDGTIRIVGTTLAGEWVAEHCCKAARFSERHIRAMRREVMREEARTNDTETRVIPFPTAG